MSNKVSVFIKFTTQPGLAAQLATHLVAAADRAATETGTELFTVSLSPATPDSVFVYEVYASQADKELHESSETYRADKAKTGSFLAGPPEVTPLLPQGGKGLDLWH